MREDREPEPLTSFIGAHAIGEPQRFEHILHLVLFMYSALMRGHKHWRKPGQTSWPGTDTMLWVLHHFKTTGVLVPSYTKVSSATLNWMSQCFVSNLDSLLWARAPISDLLEAVRNAPLHSVSMHRPPVLAPSSGAPTDSRPVCSYKFVDILREVKWSLLGIEHIRAVLRIVEASTGLKRNQLHITYPFAGHGLEAAYCADSGCDPANIDASDLHPPGNPCQTTIPIRQCDAQEAIAGAPPGPASLVILIWLPQGWWDLDVLFQSKLRPDWVLFVGEGENGCTGGHPGYFMERGWRGHRLGLVSWPGINDECWLFRRA